jgi:HEAT repeat protein
MQKNAIWLSVWFVLLLVLIGTVLWRFVPRGEATPATLAERALTASSPDEQMIAAAELCTRGEAARPYLRKLMAESQNDNVRAIAMDGLGVLRDYKSMEALMTAMDDPSVLVRTRAGAAVGRIVGLDRRFNAGASPEERQKVIALVRDDWARLLKSDFFQKLIAEQAAQEQSHGQP